jgi:hypothetical protein
MKIVNYTTVTADDFRSLDEQVCKMLGGGFQPYGNPYTIYYKSAVEGGVIKFTVAQAMIEAGRDECTV